MCLYIIALGVWAINYTCPAADMWLIRSGKTILQVTRNSFHLSMFISFQSYIIPEGRAAVLKKETHSEILTIKVLNIFRGSMPKLFEKLNQDYNKEKLQVNFTYKIKEQLRVWTFFYLVYFKCHKYVSILRTVQWK